MQPGFAFRDEGALAEDAPAPRKEHRLERRSLAEAAALGDQDLLDQVGVAEEDDTRGAETEQDDVALLSSAASQERQRIFAVTDHEFRERTL